MTKPKPAPAKPYYAAIFTSVLGPGQDGYEETSEKMLALVKRQPGFLGFDSVRGDEGAGITVSYWESLEALRAWGAVPEHHAAQTRGKSECYSRYRIRVAEVIEDWE